MIDHITIATTNVEESRIFYERAFRPLGYVVAFGEENIFWAFRIDNGALFEIRAARGDEQSITSSHVAFRVSSRELVDGFYEAALNAGGKDNGEPGPRPQYSMDYYACFIYDPDGHNIEAMIKTEAW
ncbi:MAG: VOC family protein [Halioglobus sp.]